MSLICPFYHELSVDCSSWDDAVVQWLVRKSQVRPPAGALLFEVCIRSLWVLRLPPTVQKHAHEANWNSNILHSV